MTAKIEIINTPVQEINEEVTLRVRFWYTGVEEIDYNQSPDFFNVMGARRKEINAALAKWKLRTDKTIASWRKDQENLEQHHDFNRSMAIANRNYDKKIRAIDKQYSKVKKAIYAKYAPVFEYAF